jgi:hypothetical protein
MTEQETRCGMVYDTKIPYDRAKLKALYGSHAAYVRKYEAAKRAAIREGYLLPEDALHLAPIAKKEDFDR